MKSFRNDLIENEALKQFKDKNYGSAMYLFKKIDHSGDFKIKQKLGICYRKTRQFEHAITAFKESLEIHESHETYTELARAYFMHRETDEAIINAKNSLILKETWQAYNQLAVAYKDQKNYTDAVIMLRASLGLYKNWQSHQLLGVVLLKLQRYEQSEQEFLASLELRSNFNTYFYLGELYRKTGKFEEALMQYDNSLEIRPQASTYQGIASIYTKKGATSKAVAALEKSISLQANPNTYRLLFNIYLDNKNYRQAISNLVQSYQFKPDATLIKEFLLLVSNCKDYEYIADLCRIIFSDSKPDQKQKGLSWTALIEIAIKTKKIDPLILHLQSAILYFSLDNEPLYNQAYSLSFFEQFLSSKSLSRAIKKEKILFGVSHSRLYYDSAWITVKECGPGTMYSINSSNSKIGHHDYILQEIDVLSPLTHDLIFEFGEIDLRAHTLKMSRKLNLSPVQVIDDAINNYMNFITQISALGYTIYISGPHCGGGRGINAKATEQQERNDLCRYMNLQLLRKCQKNKFLFYTIFDIAVDQKLMRERSHFFYDEIHLKLPPNQFGSLLRAVAEQRICSAAQDVGYYESYLSDKVVNAPFKVIYSNLNAISSSSILQPGILVNAVKLKANQQYYLLLELPYPSIFELTLTFSTHISTLDCFAIFESFDPSHLENTPNLVECIRYNHMYDDNHEVKLSVCNKEFFNRKCNYVLLSMGSFCESSIYSIKLCSKIDI